jgi:hypothetical protein
MLSVAEAEPAPSVAAINANAANFIQTLLRNWEKKNLVHLHVQMNNRQYSVLPD